MSTGTDHNWQARLYVDKAAKLILYGRALGLSHSEAEDVLQETFIALLRLSAEPEKPEHYALRSFRNRAVNHHRSLWRRVTRELESRRWFERTPDESPLEREAMRCLAGLPAAQREAVVLKIWHEYTFEEIGALLEVSPNTVAARYRYALKKLRTCLKGEIDEQPERTGDALAALDAARSLGEA
jgi:RNA polymerase sigma-70 factor (ECF subfamily)